MDIVAATRAYERWLRTHVATSVHDLKLKHEKMSSGGLPFLRATFYRWVTLWPEACPELLRSPKVLAVGDLHIENFGTWRDMEGRLVWGVNDFDEAYPAPYTCDLVRLATSALLAVHEKQFSVSASAACDAILGGYSETIGNGIGDAFVLEERNTALRAIVLSDQRDPARFWSKLTKLKSVEAPREVDKLLRKSLAAVDGHGRIVHPAAGLGSLGRPRYALLGTRQRGYVAREAKAIVPSAFAWAERPKEQKLFYNAILKRAVRSPDPFTKCKNGWLIRRLAPHCSKIDLADFARPRDEVLILTAMGSETANVHLGASAIAPSFRRDLKRLGRHWLYESALKMRDITLADWKNWNAK